MMRITGFRLITLLVALLLVEGTARADNVNMYKGTFSYSILGGYEFPMGSYAKRLDNGVSGGLSLQYVLPWDLPPAFQWCRYYFLDLSFRYLNTSLEKSPKSGINWFSVDAGPVFYYPLFKWAAPCAGFSLGLFYNSMVLDSLDRKESTFNVLLRARGGIIFPATSSLSFRLEGLMSYYNMNPSSYRSFGISLSASYNFSGDLGTELSKGDSRLLVINRKLKDVYAIRYQQYNTGGIGTITVRNTGETPLFNVRADVQVERIASQSKSTDEIKTLEPGDERTLQLPVTINGDVYTITDDCKLSVRCRLVYGTTETRNYYTEVMEIPFYNKNAITWDMTEHLGSFIMPHDGTVSLFARKSLADSETLNAKGIPRKLLSAMILFDAIKSYGIIYASDPNSGYAAVSLNREVVDYVQLPCETLRKKAGDCDDLTALYASLLENVGISTAIATVPGHVFILFDTEISESNATQVCDDCTLYMVHDKTIWIPVEVTALDVSFMQAWKEGAREVQGGSFEYTETARAWETFPSAVMETEFDIDFPRDGKLADTVGSDVSSLKELMYENRMKLLLSSVQADAQNYRAWNELGIIYGRNGQIADAEVCFSKSLAVMPSYHPALSNMGNICMIKKEFEKAVGYYEKALAVKPDDVNTRINYARALYELKNYEKAREEYGKAVLLNAGLAARYRYLAQTAGAGRGEPRASNTSDKNELILWSRDF